MKMFSARAWRAGGRIRFGVPAGSLLALLMSGCDVIADYIAIDPKGPVAEAETQIFYNSLAIMLTIGAPVIVAIFAFAWWFRRTNAKALHLPDWHYSGKIELVVWAVPALVVLFLAPLAVIGAQRLDPRAPLPAVDKKPLEIQVVALDWKWLFVYPEAGVASVNELALPTGTPIRFRLTSATVMNSFFIPNLGSQIYTMGGMETALSLLAREPGDFLGLSAQLSGVGFTDMRFRARAMTPEDFAAWLDQARQNANRLDRETYAALLKPGRETPHVFGAVEKNLFDAIVARTAPTPENAAACAPPTRVRNEEPLKAKGS